MRIDNLLVAVVCISGCVAIEPDTVVHQTRDQALIGGELAGDDPGVVALTVNNNPFCSGTLVSPSVVLTAAHCIDMAGANPNIAVFFGADSYGDGSRTSAQRVQQHLNWTGNLSGKHDIGLLLLDAPRDPSLAVPMNTSPATQHIGESYRVVGFGQSDNNGTSDGKKREGTVTIARTTPPPGDEIIIDDPDTIVCFGDSGGPGFITIDGVEYVAGVHSWTTRTNQNPCGPDEADTRVDLYAEDFLKPWIQQNDLTCRQDWRTCASVGCTNDPDCEPCGPDGTCTSGCDVPDPDCRTSELGEICQIDSQCMSDRCLTFLAEPSTRFCSRDCSSDDDCADGMACLTINPFGKVCYFDDGDIPPGVLGSNCDHPSQCGAYTCDESKCAKECDLSIGLRCPADFECRESSAGGFFCHSTKVEDDGGCRAGQQDGLILLGFLLVMTARRSREATLL